MKLSNQLISIFLLFMLFAQQLVERKNFGSTACDRQTFKYVSLVELRLFIYLFWWRASRSPYPTLENDRFTYIVPYNFVRVIWNFVDIILFFQMVNAEFSYFMVLCEFHDWIKSTSYRLLWFFSWRKTIFMSDLIYLPYLIQFD